MYVAAVETLEKDRMKLTQPPKFVEKLVWIPVFPLCKIFILSYTFDAPLCRNWLFSPPNRLTLYMTLMCKVTLFFFKPDLLYKVHPLFLQLKC
jgi:hypothetical protein